MLVNSRPCGCGLLPTCACGGLRKHSLWINDQQRPTGDCCMGSMSVEEVPTRLSWSPMLETPRKSFT